MNIFKNYIKLWMLLIASIMSCVAIAQDENYGIGDGFDPANPGNPGSNGWNAATGEVIIDDFTTGNLNNSITKIIGNSGSAAVTQIVVAGVINNTDFRVGNNYAKCTLVDFSRTAGISTVPSSAYSGNTHLCSIMLPTSITDIGSKAFNGCSALTAMTCYTLTPPKVGANAFSGVADGMVVYVPSEAVDRYIEADIWKDFTILPIQETVHSLTVKLPNDIDISTFKNMTLELVNAKSGQSYRYIITEKTSYVFNNLIENTVYKAYVKNNQNNIFGETNEVSINDKDAEVTFASLSIPQNVNLSIIAGGNDITSQSTVTWTDSLGNYLSQGASLSGYAIGKKLNYSIVLPQNIVMEYALPNTTQYVVTDGGNNIVCTLTPLQKVVITGKVLDLTTKSAISGAVVSASQTFGGKYSKTTNVKTDAKGQYSIEIFRVPTSLAIAASDYISQTMDCDVINAEGENVSVADVSLKSISGAVISIDFTYKKCPDNAGEEGEVESFYSDYNNVDYAIFNKTQNRSIGQFNAQYPQIVLLEEVIENDILEITASSRISAFVPVKATATIDAEQHASATFDIVELGKLKSSFVTNTNASVVGSLYDANGKLIKTYDYSGGSLTISNLADGDYTLVTMGSSRLFNTIYDLNQLPQTGLTKDVDYVQNSVSIKSGELSIISIAEVPTLDESKLFYTGDNTSFTVNKSSIVAGNYLTLTGHIDFKSAYSTKVSNVNLIVDLPESCSFVENSVMVGNSTSSYTLEGNRVIIPMTRYTDRVRFCIIPTLGGEYSPSALAQFDIDGETITQPIGSANYTAKDLSISVPSTVAKTTIPVSGTAIGASDIEIYDGDVLIGQTKSLANGLWTTTCELNKPYNLSRHNIYAKVKTKTGLELSTEIMLCQYDKNSIEVKTVTMVNTAHTAANLKLHDYVTVFDFQNPTSTAPVYWYWPSYPDFTFIIDLTNNDSTVVDNVIVEILTSSGSTVPLIAHYDRKRDKWVASGSFKSQNLPVNVAVKYLLTDNKIEADMDYVSDMQLTVNNLVNDYVETIGRMEKVSVEIDEYVNNIQDWTDFSEKQLNNLMSKYDQFDLHLESSNDISDKARVLIEELESANPEIDNTILFEKIQEYIKTDIESYFMSTNEVEKLIKEGELIDGDNHVYYQSDVHLSEQELINMGFDRYETTDNGNVYAKTSDGDNRLYDPVKGKMYVTKGRPSGLSIEESTLNDINSYIGITQRGWLNATNNISNALTFATPFTLYKLYQIIDESQLMKKLALMYLYSIPDRTNRGKEFESVAKCLFKNRECIAKANQNIHMINVAGNALAFAASALSGVTGHYDDKIEGLDLLGNIYLCTPAEKHEYFRKKLERIDRINVGFTAVQAGISFASALVIQASLPATGPTLGASLVVGTVALGANYAVNTLLDCIRKHGMKETYKTIAKEIDWEKCQQSLAQNYPWLIYRESDCAAAKYVQDPSGYVYEGVSSNRLEGVTATAYYKETVEDMYGDKHENIVKWDASEYAQENPLFTDENGMYAWDVPNGLWQVKFEKEGYETTYSEWLPVPPPQLDINIAMKQNIQPTVKAARAFEDAVEMEFDKYMLPEMLNTENIRVMAGETAVEGTVELLNEEVSYEGNEEKFASKVRFNAAAPFDDTEVTLTVSNRVKSYAGIRMQDDFSQTFTIEPEIREIVCDEETSVVYGKSAELTVQVLPSVASAGKTLKVKSSSAMILSTDAEELTLDSEGKASLRINGELPGSAAITYSIDGYDLAATTLVNVELSTIGSDNPSASIASGSAVLKGTAVTLSCPVKDAVIYYTTDGSCPCGSEAKQYDGTPITIVNPTTLKIMSVGKDGAESDIVEYTYTIRQTNLQIPLAKGWNWVSHNRYDDMNGEELMLSDIERVLTQNSEIYRDPQIGFTGHLDKISANDAFKVKNSAATSIALSGDMFNAANSPVTLKKGWNWLGCPLYKSIALNDALSLLEPEEGDYIVNIEGGFSQYDGTQWTGTLSTLNPGQGYLFKSASDKELTYNTSPSAASAAYEKTGESTSLIELPWHVDVHKYPDVMCVTGELYANDVKANAGDYIVAAFVDGECRGIGQYVGDILYLAVHGDQKAEVTFLAMDSQSGIVYEIKEKLEYVSDVIGTASMPFRFQLGNTTDIGKLMSDKSVPHSMYNILGQKMSNISHNGIYIINGSKRVVTRKSSYNRTK